MPETLKDKIVKKIKQDARSLLEIIKNEREIHTLNQQNIRFYAVRRYFPQRESFLLPPSSNVFSFIFQLWNTYQIFQIALGPKDFKAFLTACLCTMLINMYLQHLIYPGIRNSLPARNSASTATVTEMTHQEQSSVAQRTGSPIYASSAAATDTSSERFDFQH